MVTTTVIGDQIIAGVVSGGAAVILLHPLDLVKTRFQATESARFIRPFAVPRELASIMRTSGVSGLYRGFSANLIGTTVSWGAYFALYRAAQDAMREIWPELGTPHYFAAASCAGALTVCITNPLWMAKTRLCQPGMPINAATGMPFTGLADCLRGTFRTEGIRGLYRGFSVGLLNTSHGAVHFTAYERLKKLVLSLRTLSNARTSVPCSETQHNSKMSTTETLAVSSAAKITASTTTYPLQVLRCRLQLASTHDAAQLQRTGALQTLYRVIASEGITGLYKGLVPNTLRVLPGTCITFAVYERLCAIL